MTAVAKISERRLSKKVDELGALNAQISLLARKADALKAELKASGYEEIFGQSYRAVISERISDRLDSEAVRKLLTPEQVRFCAKQSESVSLSLYDL